MARIAKDELGITHKGMRSVGIDCRVYDALREWVQKYNQKCLITQDGFRIQVSLGSATEKAIMDMVKKK